MSNTINKAAYDRKHSNWSSGFKRVRVCDHHGGRTCQPACTHGAEAVVTSLQLIQAEREREKLTGDGVGF